MDDNNNIPPPPSSSSHPPSRCFPTCKIPEKRDFMDVNPERSEMDFYKNYDPMIGIGTAAILIVFFIVITIKSFIRWMIRKYKLFKYRQAARKLSKLQTANNNNTNVTTKFGYDENKHNIDNNNFSDEVSFAGKQGRSGSGVEMALNGKLITNS